MKPTGCGGGALGKIFSGWPGQVRAHIKKISEIYLLKYSCRVVPSSITSTEESKITEKKWEKEPEQNSLKVMV